jgi:transglutaminase/protease-like cytokinesis protein 3
MIHQRKAICAGYATLLEYMSEHVGLTCEFVPGSTSGSGLRAGGDHAWNAVKLDGRWYLADATWASGAVDPDTKGFLKQFDPIYFLSEPALLIASHYPKDTKWTLIKDPPSFAEFAKAPGSSHGFIRNRINQYRPTVNIIRIKKNEFFEVGFTSNVEKVSEHAVVEWRERSDKVYSKNDLLLTKTKTGEYVLKFMIPKNGVYYCHIIINGYITFVYQVIVS